MSAVGHPFGRFVHVAVHDGSLRPALVTKDLGGGYVDLVVFDALVNQHGTYSMVAVGMGEAEGEWRWPARTP